MTHYDCRMTDDGSVT